MSICYFRSSSTEQIVTPTTKYHTKRTTDEMCLSAVPLMKDFQQQEQQPELAWY